MNAETEIAPDTAVAIIGEADLPGALQDPKRMTALVAGVRKKVAAFQHDMTTARGRDATRSFAAEIASTKTGVDKAALALTEVWRKSTADVNAVRKSATADLQALQDEARQPLTDYETAEKARRAQIQEALAAFALDSGMALDSSEHLDAILTEVSTIDVVTESLWTPYQDVARERKAAAVKMLTSWLANAVEREAQAAELVLLRAQAEERDRADRLRAEEAAAEAKRIADVAAAAERRQRQEAEEAERQASIVREREEAAARAAEAARVAAEAAAAEKVAAAERAAREAEERAAEAVRLEQERAARERQEAFFAQAERDADTKLRAKARAAIIKALDPMILEHGEPKKSTLNRLADALMAGAIPHVTVTL